MFEFLLIKKNDVRSFFYLFIFIVIHSCTSTRDVQDSSFSTFAQAQQFRLAAPIIKAEDIFFSKKNEIQFLLRLEKSKIHYTLDGSEPTENSPLYHEKVVLFNSAIVKAKAFHPECKPSEITTKEFVKLGKKLKVKNISVTRNPHKNYPGNGVNGLIDRKKGTDNFRTPFWMGFEGGDLETIIEFEKEESVSKVTASLLSDPNAWIFMPKTMMVLGSKDGGTYEILNTLESAPTPEGTSTSLRFLTAEFPNANFKFIKVLLKSFPEIPKWHPGKGSPPWLFIDEIIVE